VRTMRDDGRLRRQALLTFELGESDLPLRPAFPVLMANLLEWLAPRTETPAQPVSPGGALHVEASPLTSALRIEPVDGSTPPEELAPPWPAREFHPPAPGVYRLIVDNPDGPSVNYVAADPFAPTEADIARTTPQFMYVASAPFANALSSVRAGIWPWLLAALLVLAAAEWLVDARGR
jgi:Ca-activated chloride channel family protein